VREPAGPATQAERESWFRALVERIPGAVYRRASEPPWGFGYVSDAVEPIAGYRPEELTGPDAVPGALAPEPEDLTALTDAIARSTATGEPFDVEYRVRMVKAYPVISGVPDAFEASWSDIEAGFERVLVARNLRRTHEMYLGAHRRRSGVSGG
jgi:PAS domain-containing protein